MRLRARPATSYRYGGFEFRQRGGKAPLLVVFYAPVAEVLLWAHVGQLGPKQTGPQRERKEARVTAIANFLAADDRNTIPTPVILAFDKGKAKFDKAKGGGGSGAGHLVIKKSDGYVAEIVDGQHRLYGMEAFDPSTNVAVVGLLEADDVERAFQFLVINNKSSRVPATHTKALLAKMQKTALSARLRGRAPLSTQRASKMLISKHRQRKPILPVD